MTSSGLGWQYVILALSIANVAVASVSAALGICRARQEVTSLGHQVTTISWAVRVVPLLGVLTWVVLLGSSAIPSVRSNAILTIGIIQAYQADDPSSRPGRAKATTSKRRNTNSTTGSTVSLSDRRQHKRSDAAPSSDSRLFSSPSLPSSVPEQSRLRTPELDSSGPYVPSTPGEISAQTLEDYHPLEAKL
ncbi:hypothetical protein FHL15_004747 [Xylaria flabelliformis]|uniref:Uncharacterized protein n=1 Tax=Xylaria flabelliformis TaxID=2512241 RepID=A0A553I250_9PEZI|nr:hypothetical protein FHL15_004747 [Xylaria flabelliformis]